jgi:2-(1,2-epoxy-1,2-dihydrophenyl)acetyl-CoA isomerase
VSAPVTLDVTAGVALIGLSRPDAGNAIDLPMARALRDAAAAVAAMPAVGAAVLFGHGDRFCVGGDLKAFAAASTPGRFMAELADSAHAAVLGLRALPVPIITAVQGACAGGGIGFALAADMIVAERTARFTAAYTAVGLSPDCSVSWTLARRLGPALASDLILTNRPLDGAEAARLGLVSRVTEPGRSLDEAMTLARSLAAGPRAALSSSVRLVRQAAEASLHHHLRAEAASIASLIETPDGTEGVSAFLERRSPTFSAPSRS